MAKKLMEEDVFESDVKLFFNNKERYSFSFCRVLCKHTPCWCNHTQTNVEGEQSKCLNALLLFSPVGLCLPNWI